MSLDSGQSKNNNNKILFLLHYETLSTVLRLVRVSPPKFSRPSDGNESKTKSSLSPKAANPNFKCQLPLFRTNVYMYRYNIPMDQSTNVQDQWRKKEERVQAIAKASQVRDGNQ